MVIEELENYMNLNSSKITKFYETMKDYESWDNDNTKMKDIAKKWNTDKSIYIYIPDDGAYKRYTKGKGVLL